MSKCGNGVFTLVSFLGKVGSKGQVPETGIPGCVVKSVTQVSRATLLHVRVTVLELPGLVVRR